MNIYGQGRYRLLRFAQWAASPQARRKRAGFGQLRQSPWSRSWRSLRLRRAASAGTKSEASTRRYRLRWYAPASCRRGRGAGSRSRRYWTATEDCALRDSADGNPPCCLIPSSPGSSLAGVSNSVPTSGFWTQATSSSSVSRSKQTLHEMQWRIGRFTSPKALRHQCGSATSARQSAM